MKKILFVASEGVPFILSLIHISEPTRQARCLSVLTRDISIAESFCQSICA